MFAGHPYRSPCFGNKRRTEALERMRCALGPKPMHDVLCGDGLPFSPMGRALELLADMVTDFYIPYLVREIRGSEHYDEMAGAASLLAFSGRECGVETLGAMLRSRRPMEVLVSVDILGDVVAFAPPGGPRSLAVGYLASSGLELAREELALTLPLSAAHSAPRQTGAGGPGVPPSMPYGLASIILHLR
ncbi:MAG: hypothetical protein AB1324_05235 [Candidatus Micrarchaeota archaeon]